jgi:exonuclease III
MDKSFVIFEAIRSKKGGGTAKAINENLKPKRIEEYSDDFELLVVEFDTREKNIRIISGYGPQENIEEEKRVLFFLALETEIEKATLAGASIIIEADMNSKLGPKYIPNDPHELSPNGSLLAAIIERQNLIVGNGSQKCRGTITRKRTTSDRTETSAIDVVMFSNDLNKHLVSVHIDEDRKHVLSKIHKTKRGVKVKESDHNSIITEFDCQIITNTDEKKVEIFDLKDKDSQAKFKAYTQERICYQVYLMKIVIT